MDKNHYSINGSNSTKIDINKTNANIQKKLTTTTKIFYSFGHVYNDLTVSIWFSYTLLYFKFQFSAPLAGALLLIGQLADAIASPFVGFHSDRGSNSWFSRYGRRKAWHLVGVLANTITVPILYNTQCLFFECESAPTWARFIYFSVLIIIFQGGWAATQVSHVTLIVDLTDDTNERIALNAYRQAATIGANICLYSVTLFVIGFDNQGTIKQEDLVVFTKVSYIVCGIGLVFSLLFHIFVKEPEFVPKETKDRRSDIVKPKSYRRHSVMTLIDTASIGRPSICYIPGSEEELNTNSLTTDQKKWWKWLTCFDFWKITIMYTMARMFVNLSQVYTPLYLQDTLLMSKITIAVIPFATYVAGLICSFAAKPISARVGSRWVLIAGALFGIASCVWIFLDSIPGFKEWQIYGVSACIGIGGTALLISSLALTSDLIGSNTSTGAFVFSAMSFFDKSFNGAVIALLENFQYTEADTERVESIAYYKWVLICITGVSSIAICLGLLAIIRTTYGRKATNADISIPNTIMH